MLRGVHSAFQKMPRLYWNLGLARPNNLGKGLASGAGTASASAADLSKNIPILVPPHKMAEQTLALAAEIGEKSGQFSSMNGYPMKRRKLLWKLCGVFSPMWKHVILFGHGYWIIWGTIAVQ